MEVCYLINKISFLDKQHAQANFYITKEFADKEEYKCGLGRYETVMNGIDKVKNEKDMFNLINKVTYFQAYFPEKCQFDYRSENVGFKPNWTTEYVMNEANRKEVEEVVNEVGNELKSIQYTKSAIIYQNLILILCYHLQRI